VKTSTPNNAGSDDRSRLAARTTVAPSPVITFQSLWVADIICG
jgi:hypothetical protein